MIAVLLLWACADVGPPNHQRRGEPPPTTQPEPQVEPPEPDPEPEDTAPAGPQPTDPVEIALDEAVMFLGSNDDDRSYVGLGANMAALDVDGDGDLDLALGSKSTEWLLRYEPGTFYGVDDAVGYVELFTSPIVSGDFDGDGDLDLAGYFYPVIGYSYVSVVFMPYDPEAAIADWALDYPPPTTNAPPCATDIDHDGYVDFLIFSEWRTLFVAYGPFLPGQTSGPTRIFSYPDGFASFLQHLQCPGDVTGDGIADLVSARSGDPIIIPGPLLRDRVEETFPYWLMDVRSESGPFPVCGPAVDAAGRPGCFANDGLRIKVLSVPLAPRGSTPGLPIGVIRATGLRDELQDAMTVTVLDFNGDGFTDYGVRVQDSALGWGLYLFLGPHDRNRAEDDFDAYIPVDAQHITVADFNHDGIDDLLISERHVPTKLYDSTIRVFLGRPIPARVLEEPD